MSMKLEYNVIDQHLHQRKPDLKESVRTEMNRAFNLLCDLAGKIGFSGMISVNSDLNFDIWLEDMPEFADQAHGLELKWQIFSNGESVYIYINNMLDRTIDCYVSTGEIHTSSKKRNMSFWTKLGGEKYDRSDRSVRFGHPDDFEKHIDQIAKYINKSNTLNKCKLQNMERLAEFKKKMKKVEIEACSGEYIAGAIEEQLKESMGPGFIFRTLVEDKNKDIPCKWTVSVSNWRNMERYLDLNENESLAKTIANNGDVTSTDEKARIYLNSMSETDYDYKLRALIVNYYGGAASKLIPDLDEYIKEGERIMHPHYFSLDKRFNRDFQQYTETSPFYFQIVYSPLHNGPQKFTISYSGSKHFAAVIKKAVKKTSDIDFKVAANEFEDVKEYVRRVVKAEEQLWKIYNAAAHEVEMLALDL